MRPIAQWATHPVANLAVLLLFRYAESREEYDRDETHAIHFVLTNAQCVELAADLTAAATRIQ
jgi:hypothetical protein